MSPMLHIATNASVSRKSKLSLVDDVEVNHTSSILIILTASDRPIRFIKIMIMSLYEQHYLEYANKGSLFVKQLTFNWMLGLCLKIDDILRTKQN